MKFVFGARSISLASFSLALALSCCAHAQTAAPDGQIMVEAQTKPGKEWKRYPTRTLANLPGYAAVAAPVETDIYGGWPAHPLFCGEAMIFPGEFIRARNHFDSIARM